MPNVFDRIKAEVAETVGVVASAIAFIGSLKQRITDLLNDDTMSEEEILEAIGKLTDDLDTATNELAAAIATDPATPPADDGQGELPVE